MNLSYNSEGPTIKLPLLVVIIDLFQFVPEKSVPEPLVLQSDKILSHYSVNLHGKVDLKQI